MRYASAEGPVRLFERNFSHYVSYGATDQHTVRELAAHFDGVLVPGTVAAFQREGTGGFVLSLSATQVAPEYVIDPRFPLFQQRLTAPKASHVALADMLGIRSIVELDRDPRPEDFDDELIRTVVHRWAQFNHGYRTDWISKFDKYARRLNEEVQPQNAQEPLCILAPYFATSGINSGWWEVCIRLYDEMRRAPVLRPVARVVAVTEPHLLGELLGSIDDQDVVVWVSGLDEIEAEPDALVSYGRALQQAHQRGQHPFALYGGFFGVLLSGAGLVGESHGIGYGENRAWIELPQSGPPPARYYLPRAHRYTSQELAYELWRRDPSIAECGCEVCRGRSPIQLEYHDLMMHSVLVRSQEISDWSEIGLAAAAEKLDEEVGEFLAALDALPLPTVFRRPADRLGEHLPRWLDAVRTLA